jgi:hypothetical protein
MSIAGKLADMSLTELLQTMALSRKSGVLEIRHGDEAAWLGVREGLIVRVADSGGDLERGRVLAASKVEDSESEAAESCLWNAAVGAVLTLMEWEAGEFTLDTSADPSGTWPGPQGVFLSQPLPSEYLMLEGARMEDEEQNMPADTGPPTMAPAPAAPPGRGPRPAAVVVVDRDPKLLEALKRTLVSGDLPIHIFQSTADGFERLKHYVVRGELPAVLIGEGDTRPLARYEDRVDVVIARLRRMAPGVRVVLLREGEARLAASADCEIARLDPGKTESHVFEAFLRKVADALGVYA